MTEERTVIHGVWPPDMVIPEKYLPAAREPIPGDTYRVVILDEARFQTDARYPDLVVEFVRLGEAGGLHFKLHYKNEWIGNLSGAFNEPRIIADRGGNLYKNFDELLASVESLL